MHTTTGAFFDLARTVTVHARRTPEVTAVRGYDGTYTFEELDQRADAIAAELIRRGIGAETAVGAHLDRSRDLVAALVGIWRAGAVFVVLDPAHPPTRLAAIAADSGVAAVVSRHAPFLDDRIARIDPATAAASEPIIPTGPQSPESLAYIVYTSGTTGEPKGVGITYGNVANLLDGVRTLAPAEGEDGGNVLAPSFDGWLWSTLIPLMNGRGVVLADPRSGDGNVPLLNGEVSFVTATPSLLAANEPPAPKAGLRTVVSAGEACAPDLAARWAAGRRFINAYGPTETTICATWADSEAGDDPTTIGHPLPNYRVQVLDERLRPVPAGQVGELFVAGAGVGRGYHNRPGATASRFLPDPSGNSERMYRTGDLVRHRADGALEFFGRIDDQLKIRGFRVEPAEIEAAARALPGVRAAAAFAVPGPVGFVLSLAVVPQEEESHEPEGVRDALRAKLPEHLVPSQVMFLDDIPRTVAGKTDQAELVRLSRTAASPAFHARLTTPTQELVAQVWSEALDISVESADADFFELGGHSLIATQVVALLRKRIGLRLTMRQLFANRTVEALAAELDKMGEAQRPGA
ncbi:non-ribosomal peptide synthetase [Salinispora arenicola]|uniref:non-ribosomal peptide synthetase n=1 Tax=Salinispora arenicola TaxID=168697 RepID=UPI0018AD32AB|nr:non-ribosomal peptide synthetase [Salinispora arenicola]